MHEPRAGLPGRGAGRGATGESIDPRRSGGGTDTGLPGRTVAPEGVGALHDVVSVLTDDGVRLHVECAGPADAPVTVVAAHGWTLDSRCWGPVADTLTAGTAGGAPALPGTPAVRVVRYDHRGHGRSGAVEPETMTIDRLADDLAAVLDAVSAEGPLVLAGHSMGGMTIMALAERHPGLVARRVAGVAFVATSSGGLADSTFGLPRRSVELVRRVERALYASRGWSRRTSLARRERLLEPGLRWLLLGPRPDRAAVRMTTQVVAQCRPLTVSGFRSTLDAHERYRALAAFAGVPVQIMVGTADRLTPPAHAGRIHEALPHAELTLFPSAGHMLPVERVDGVSARIARLARACVVDP